MKIVVCGTHFTPAQAAIELLVQRPNIQVVYIGRAHTREGDKSPSVESQVLPALGVKFRPIVAGRLQRFWSLYTLWSLLKLPIGFIQAFWMMVEERPQVVLSLGGYLSVPVVFAAWLLSIPVVIHEQTLVSALANRIASLMADKIAVSYAASYDYPHEKVVLTGNPIRSELLQPESNPTPEVSEVLAEAKRLKLPLVYISGGNQGSHVLNQAIWEILPELTEKAVVIHSTGESKYQDYDHLMARQTEIESPSRYLALKWLSGPDLAPVMGQADLAVGRAGANSLMELAWFELPVLTIPLPYLNQNEQLVNAKYYHRLGLAQILSQNELTGPKLLVKINRLLGRRVELKKAAQGAKKVVIPSAAERLVMETLLLVTPEAEHNLLDPYAIDQAAIV